MDGDPGPLALTRAALVALGERIERLALDPKAVRAGWIWIARPVLRALGYRPRFDTVAIAALLEALRAPDPGGAPDAGAPPPDAGGEPLPDLLEHALEELERNVAAAERACVVHRRLSMGHAAWLHRLQQIVARAACAVLATSDDASRRVAAAIDPALLLPPLRLEAAEEKKAPERAPDEPGDGPDEAPEARAEPPEARGGARRIELELAAIDRVLEAAQAEGEFLGRRRRLLEAARALLLDAAAALPVEARGVEQRHRAIAREIARVDRFEGAGLAPSVGLLHQARGALARGDAERLHAALVALDGAALAAGRARAAAKTAEALRRSWGGARGARGAGWDDAAAVEASLDRSADEVLGHDVAGAVRKAFDDAREALGTRERGVPTHVEGTPPDPETGDPEAYRLAVEHLAPGAERSAFAALLAVDGCFDVGAALSPVRVAEIELRARAVAHPTPDMILLPARSIEDLPGAVVDDPRALLASLAAGRLLTRKFVEQEPVPRERTRLVGEARIYVLDGSTSMIEEGLGGARARMRDAILVAELATVLRRLSEPSRRTRVVLFYRYFTKRLGPVVRVDSGPSALAAMGDVLGTIRHGGTDIEQALTTAFELVRDEGKRDPDLARAQIVLITDGRAPVREDAVRAARERAGAVPVRVSVIALGEENPALRALVARQRARGERAFYHHMDDEALRDVCERRLDRGPSIHLPDDRARLPRPAQAAALKAELGGLLDELAALEQPLAADAVHAPDAAELEALRELGVAAAHLPGASEAALARREAQDRERRALDRRFARWFPPAPDAPQQERAPEPEPGTPERDALDAAAVVLGTVAEVVGELGGGPLARRADAIELVERLLPDAGLSPARWHAALRDHAAHLAPQLRAVHAAVAATGDA